jgi:hypothetical protein
MASPIQSTPSAPERDETHNEEEARQAEIQAQLVKENPLVAGTPAEPVGVPDVKLVPTDAAPEYPFTLSLPNHEDLTFDSEDSSFEVPAVVGEQVRFVDSVKVVA